MKLPRGVIVLGLGVLITAIYFTAPILFGNKLQDIFFYSGITGMVFGSRIIIVEKYGW